MPKPKLLIVEDDEDIRSQMRWALATDYDVRLAEDRAQAVQAFKEARRFAEAEAAYREAIKRKPGDWYGHLLLGLGL